MEYQHICKIVNIMLTIKYLVYISFLSTDQIGDIFSSCYTEIPYFSLDFWFPAHCY